MRAPQTFVAALGAALLLLITGGTAVAGEHGYTVGIGDVLKVEAFQHEEISGEFPVEESGAVVFPLLGEVEVVGRTTAEVAHRLEELLERDYYVDVQLQVEVAEYRSQPVTVVGEVQEPGTYYLRGRTSLTQILAEAGGLRPTAGAELELRRFTMDPDGEETQISTTFDTRKVATGEEGRDEILRSGDVVSVPARRLYFVTGEVAKPGQYEISPGLTLMQAISQSGGLGKFASQEVELHRDGDDGKVIVKADLADIRKGREPDPAIRAGDVIIVRRRFF